MEIEAKFAVIGVLSASDIQSLDLRPYTLKGGERATHYDTLLDTASAYITGQRYALRIRESSGSHILTFKGPDRGMGGVHEREEIEAILKPPIEYDPNHWPEPIGERVRDLTEGEPLHPILRLAVERQLWTVRRGGRLIGELALDTGVILAGGRREPLRELELELKESGGREDLDTLSKRLMDRLSLVPEERSKLQRGLALLRHSRWTLDSFTSLDAIARHYVRRKTRSLRHAAHRVRTDGDADAIHDMRVATRRLRSILVNMDEMGVYRRKPIRKLREALGRIARTLGAVRDLDIILALLAKLGAAPEAKKKDGHDEPIARLVAGLRTRRDHAYAELLDAMKRSDYDDALSRLDNLNKPGSALRAGAPCLRVRDWAGGALMSRYDAIAQHGDAFDLDDTTEMHQARIAGKRMRYTIEMLAPALGPALTPVRASLHALQEEFGGFIDTVVTLRALDELDLDGVDRAGRNWRDLVRSLEEERAQRRDRAREAWNAIETGELKQTLLQAIKDL
jgi:inorganic triphosphatase YgiF